jgi:alpha-tubulin suppressor-like RCC1 family protein
MSKDELKEDCCIFHSLADFRVSHLSNSVYATSSPYNLNSKFTNLHSKMAGFASRQCLFVVFCIFSLSSTSFASTSPNTPTLLVAYGYNGNPTTENQLRYVLTLDDNVVEGVTLPPNPFQTTASSYNAFYTLLHKDIVAVEASVRSGLLVLESGKVMSFGASQLTGANFSSAALLDLTPPVNVSYEDGVSRSIEKIATADQVTVILADSQVWTFGSVYLVQSSIPSGLLGPNWSKSAGYCPTASLHGSFNPRVNLAIDVACTSVSCAAITRSDTGWNQYLMSWGVLLGEYGGSLGRNLNVLVPNGQYAYDANAVRVNTTFLDPSCDPGEFMATSHLCFFVRCANLTHGGIMAFGSNQEGACVEQNEGSSLFPQVLHESMIHDITRIVCGDYHCVALTSPTHANGTSREGNPNVILGWGSNSAGQLSQWFPGYVGIMNEIEIQFSSSLEHILDIGAAMNNTFLLTRSFKLYYLGWPLPRTGPVSHEPVPISLNLPIHYAIRSLTNAKTTGFMSYFLATPPSATGCTSLSPGATYTCMNGVWVSYVPIETGDDLILVPGGTQIVGNVTVAPNATVYIPITVFNTSAPLLIATGCINVTGLVVLQITPEQIQSLPEGEIKTALWKSGCATTIPSLSLSNSKSGCKSMTVTPTTESNGKDQSLIAIFLVSNDKSCDKKKSNLWWILVASIGGGVVLITAAVVLVAVFFPSVRKSCSPGS